MAGESSKTTMLTPGGLGPPRIHRTELSREVETVFASEFESYKSDRRWGGLGEGVAHVEAKGQLLDSGQRSTLTSWYFGRGRILCERELEEGLELVS